MFEIINYEDQILVDAEKLNNKDHIEQLIHDNYTMRLIPNVGLCCAVLQIIASSGYLYEGDAIYQVHLKVLVFRATINEIFIGTIVDTNEEFIRVQFMGIVEAEIKPRIGSVFEEGEWVWKRRFYYDVGQQIRFRIHQVKDERVIAHIDEDGLGVLNWWQD